MTEYDMPSLRLGQLRTGWPFPSMESVTDVVGHADGLERGGCGGQTQLLTQSTFPARCAAVLAFRDASSIASQKQTLYLRPESIRTQNSRQK
jgi:hypothetical protein